LTKSGFIVGGVVGATAIILLFAFILIPSQEIGTPDLITSNGHDATTLGDVLFSIDFFLNIHILIGSDGRKYS